MKGEAGAAGRSARTNPADFLDAHRRHWQDAELLFDEDRWPNADQLYGFSVECALKAMMKSRGMKTDASGAPESPRHRKHVQDIWRVFKSFMRGKQGSWFRSKLPPGEPFADWSHHDRYSASRCFSKKGVEPHRGAARSIRRLVQRARLDGRL